PDTAAIGRYQRRYHLRLPDAAQISCLLEDREGNAWLGTAGQGLWRHSDRYLRLDPRLPGSIDQSPALATQNPDEHSVAIGAIGGQRLFFLRGDKARQMQDVPAPPRKAVQFLLPFPPTILGRGYWVGTAEGLYVAANPDTAFRAVVGLPNNIALSITALAYARSSGLWVGTAGDGLYNIPKERNRPTRHFTTANGLLHNTVTTLLADRTGRIWVGSHDTGLAAFEPATQKFAAYRLTHTGLDVSSITEDADGRLWLATEGDGVFFREPSKTWQPLGAGSTAEYTYNILPLPNAEDGPQLLLVHRQGLSLLNCRTHRLTPLAAEDDPLARDLLGPAAYTSGSGAWLSTRAGLLRLDVAAARRQ
ncbi:ligand-binding sensor domain-containing protein, partial [Hymenobacter agri]